MIIDSPTIPSHDGLSSNVSFDGFQQNHWPDTFDDVNYTFPSFPSIPPQLSLLVKNVDLRLDFNEFSQEIKTRYPQVTNVIRLKNKFNNDVKLVKLEVSSSTLREELLIKRQITVGYIVYDIDEYLVPANILICSKCMGLGQFMKQCTKVKSTCRTCGECADDLKLYICSKIEKCIHCGQNHNSNFPPMPMPQFLPTNSNNTMLTKLDDLLGKITEVNNHLSNLELKYNHFEQFMIEKKESDLLVKENLNLLSKQSVEFKKDLVRHSVLIERHKNLFMKLIVPMFEDLFGLIASQNQDKKGNILDPDLKLKLERYLIQMKKIKEGENKNGGVIMLIKEGISISRVPCKLSNVCVVDVKGEEEFRLTGVYAPDSKSWSWDDLSDFLSKKYIIYGDFNVDIMQDRKIAEILLQWADEQFLAQALPNSPTSLRSDSVIDYTFVRVLNLDIQVFNGNTISDHFPILSVIPFKLVQQKLEKNTHWKVCCFKKIAKKELNLFFSSQLDNLLRLRNAPSSSSISFWYRSKRFLKPSSSSLHALIDSSGQIVKESDHMCNVAADYYEDFFKASYIVRPHPYTDSPPIEYANNNEFILEVTLDELINTVLAKKKKKSLDAHGISNYMFNFLDLNYWSLLLKLYNHSFQKSVLPSAWKDTRMILLAKKDSICPPSLTRPISLPDSFQKIGEKLFLTRFRDLLFRRDLLPDNQSSFRERFRLQTRLLLFLEDVYSLLSNSAPVCTIFVDFHAAFDQLWFLGCIGKLRNLGIPPSFLNWIKAWLNNRRCFIETNGSKSRWFSIEKDGPQGSVLTPTLFITYNCDMGCSLSGCISHFFADDLAGIMAGQLGIKYSSQCLDLEKRVKVFLGQLEYYSCLTDQPINFNKTEAMFTVRAIGNPNSKPRNDQKQIESNIIISSSSSSSEFQNSHSLSSFSDDQTACDLVSDTSPSFLTVSSSLHENSGTKRVPNDISASCSDSPVQPK
ncbi:unnamed protein product [Rotaria sordida]|uniref:Reverse transcriptase domain-containing protein n=2 Tax=Rotaria sordida TaxID=392033 RepID=A0A814ZQ88_9BILA|nr:unnamed protein product [Rotaria sordida]